MLKKLEVGLGIADAEPTTGPTPRVRCYHKDGELIWSSTWLRFETKCLMIIALAGSVVLGSLVRSGLRKIRPPVPAVPVDE